MKDVGECLNKANGFVCTEGKHMNYPCPYGSNIERCPCSINITEKMAEQWKEKERISLSFSEIKYNPLERRKG